VITSRLANFAKASTLTASIAALALGCLATGRASANDSTDNPYSPAYGHTYRHGVVPTREAWEHMKEYAAHNAAPGAPAASSIAMLSTYACPPWA